MIRLGGERRARLQERATVRALARQVLAARLALGRRVSGPPEAEVDRVLGELWRRRFVGELPPIPATWRAPLEELGVFWPDAALLEALEPLLTLPCDTLLAERLAQAHELTLQQRLEAQGGELRHVPSGRRRRRGVYYTPGDVVRFIVEETLGACLAPWEAELSTATPARARDILGELQVLRLLDPACGAGAFLLVALRRLRAAYRQVAARLPAGELPAPGREALAHNLHGVDLDARALALAELVLLAEVADEPGETPRLVGAVLHEGDHLAPPDGDARGFSHARAFPQVFAGASPGFAIIVGNPPYARLGADERARAQAAGYQAAEAPDLYALFVEGLVRLSAPDARGGLIVPLSLTFSRSFASLRAAMLASGRRWRLASFDRIPSGLFEAEVRTRTTIVLMDPPGQRVPGLATTPLRRFTARERPRVFEDLRFHDADGLDHPQLGFPKLGSALQATWLRRLLARGETLAAACDRRGEHRLHYKTNCYAFAIVSAELPPAFDLEGVPVPQTKYAALRFATAEERDQCLALLAGRWLFWWWFVYGDGFDLTGRLIGAFPLDPRSLPAGTRATLGELGRALQAAMRAHVAYKKNGGKRIGTFDLRACRELSDRADLLVARALDAEDLLADVRAFLERTHGTG